MHSRWFILTAWLWFVRNPKRETRFTRSEQHANTGATALEESTDLAHRGYLSMALGRALMKIPADDNTDLANEADRKKTQPSEIALWQPPMRKNALR